MSANQIFQIEVPLEQAGQRLDRFLATLEFIPSRSRAAELIHRNLVTLAGQTLKASFKVSAGCTLRIELPAAEPSTLQPLDAPLDILYEDDDLIVVNKPSGLVVHPAAGHAQDTLVNILLHHAGALSMGFSEQRPGIVHRLDRDTSGILVVAKNDHTHHGLAEQFRNKSAQRVYWAVVSGLPTAPQKTYRSHLARHPHDRKRFASNPSGVGKLAITHMKVLQTLPNKLTWVQCQLETGRTHQIRVHLSEAGLPILGDSVYGAGARKFDFPRLALHACELGFVHPANKKALFFKVGWPEDLRLPLNKFGFSFV